MWWKGQAATRQREANLARLPDVVRRAIEAAPAGSLADGRAPEHTTLAGPDGVRHRLHPDAPEQNAEREAERLLAGHPDAVIVIGLGLGYLLEALERRSATVRVVAIEPLPAVTQLLFSRRDWSTWLTNGRLSLLVGPDYPGRAEAWRLLGRGVAPVVASPVLGRVAPGAVAAAKQLAGTIVAGARANDEARRRFAGRYLLNTLANIPVIATESDAGTLEGALSGLPAIVVAAGPSLDHALDDLRARAGRAVLIAVDTAARPLLAAGIHPDIVVGVDPSDANARHLRAMPDVRGAWFVAEGSLHPDVFDQFAGRTFTFRVADHDPWPWLASNGARRGSLRAWGSVLTTAFDLALRAGCGPVAFVGADLAYTDGQLYCRNTVYEPEWRHLPTREARADAFAAHIASTGSETAIAVDGRPVTTAPRFLQFRDWLVARANEATVRVVNATGRGILAGGRIEQGGLEALDLAPVSEGKPGVQARLRAAWRRDASERDRALLPLAEACGAVDDSTLDRWFAFGGDTVTRDAMAGAVAVAGERLAALGVERRRLQHRRADNPPLSRREAQELSHGYYDLALRKAPSTQAHLLLEYGERTYAVDARHGVTGVLRAVSAPPAGLRALDVGCGVGRAMLPLVSLGVRVDGADADPRLLAHARATAALSGCRFYETAGDDCGDAPDGAYDLVYSQLCFRLVPSRDTRRRLLRAMARALRPGGMVSVQMRYHRECTAATVPAPHRPWRYEADGRGEVPAGAELWPTPDDLPLVLQDFGEWFRDVRLQFLDFAGDAGLPSQLIVSGSTEAGLASRLYALTDAALVEAA